jgi:RNA polymerase sigma-70 factor (ECF subfamily)
LPQRSETERDGPSRSPRGEGPSDGTHSERAPCDPEATTTTAGQPSAATPPLLGNRTDACWVADLRAGGRRTSDALADLSGILRRGLARGLFRDRPRAERDENEIDDHVQEALLRILDRLDSYRGDARFTTWAIAVAVRVALTRRRSAQGRDRTWSQLAPGETLQFPTLPAVADEVEGAEERRHVVEALRRSIAEGLTERQRHVVLAELAGLPKDRVAADLGISTNALYKAGHDARVRLRDELVARGVTAHTVHEAFATLETASYSHAPATKEEP